MSKWSGKKVAFLGDSITGNGEYVASYKSLTGCAVYNYGVGGSHIAKSPDEDGTRPSFEERYTSIPTDADLVIVFGGTNDFGHSSEHYYHQTTAPFGSFADGANNNTITFYAGLHRLFAGLYSMFKDKPIVVITPIHRGTLEYTVASDGTLTEGTNATSGKTFKEYVCAIKEVAAYYSLPVIDAYAESGLNPIVDSSYFKDGLHPNDAGGLKLAKWMYPHLEEIYDMFY